MSDNAKRRTAVKKRKRYTFNTRFYALVTALIVIVVGVVLSTTVFFNSTSITVTGTDLYSYEQVLNAGRITVGDNLFAMNIGNREKLIAKTLAYAEKVEIKRHLPTRLEIKITQAKPMMNVADSDGKFYLVSNTGKVLEKALAEPRMKYTTVYGYDEVDTAIAEKMVSNSVDKQKLVDKIFESCKKSGIEGIRSIDLTDMNSITIKYNDAQNIFIGENKDIEFKLELAKAIIDKRANPNEKGTVNVESTQYPAFIAEHDSEVPAIDENIVENADENPDDNDE